MIGFLHPWALAGLAAAAIPVLLHLLARREPPTVVFPAVRYLITTTREHQRRLKLQHLLLLLLRTLLIVALVLAAAGPTLPRSGVAGHAPSALVLVVDNSPSSGVVVAGAPRLAQLQAAARQVLARATPDDALWLLAADGVPRRGDRQTLLDASGRAAGLLPPSGSRRGAGVAGEVLATESRPGEIEPAHRPAGQRRIPGDRRGAAARGPARRPGLRRMSASRDSRPDRSPGAQTAAASPSRWSGDSGGGDAGERAPRHPPGAAGAGAGRRGGRARDAGRAERVVERRRRARSRRAPARRPAGRCRPGGAGGAGELGLDQPIRRRRLRGAAVQPPHRARATR